MIHKNSGGPTEKGSNSSADRKTVEVISQRYNKLHEVHRKKKKKNLSRFNTRSELIMTNILRAEGINIVCTAYEKFSQE